MPLIIIVDNPNVVKWWVDAPYEMHPDFHVTLGQRCP